MIDPKKLEEIASQITQNIPAPIKQLAAGAEDKIKQTITHQLSKLDLVTREEFEIQQQVLLRTRQKLNELEAKLAELEK